MQIKILQWNIWYCENIENIAKQIKELDPDIVCLQELGIDSKYNQTQPNTAEFIKKQLDFYSFFKIAQTWKNGSSIGNGIFSRFPIKNTRSTFVQEPAISDTDYEREGRVYLEGDLQIDDTVLTVGTIHMSYIHAFTITDLKKREVDNLLKIIKEKKEHYIITGDFNSTPESYTVSEISKYLNKCSPDFNQKTWTTKPFDYNGFKEDKLNWRLDYIFGTDDISVAHSQVVETHFSDHLPILTRFTI